MSAIHENRRENTVKRRYVSYGFHALGESVLVLRLRNTVKRRYTSYGFHTLGESVLVLRLRCRGVKMFNISKSCT